MEKFTVEETNLICIYNTGTRTQLLSGLRVALPGIDDPDMRIITDSAVKKLENMTDTEFSDIIFEPAYPVAFPEDESEGF